MWITARCRYRLQEGIDAAGINFLYCDTDSVKYLNDCIDYEAINKEALSKAKKAGAYATDIKGRVHYIGLYEKEDHMKRFKTLGAKKYGFVDTDNELHITIAGVNKKIGAIELKRAADRRSPDYGPPVDPLLLMDPGFKFIYAGGLEARYKDEPDIREWINEDGVPIRITRNVSLVENTKTLSMTPEYLELIQRECKRLMTLDK